MADPIEPDPAVQLQFIIDSPVAWAGTKCKARENLHLLTAYPKLDRRYLKRWIAATIKALETAQARADAGLPPAKRPSSVNRGPARKPRPQFPAWMEDRTLLPKRPPGRSFKEDDE